MSVDKCGIMCYTLDMEINEKDVLEVIRKEIKELRSSKVTYQVIADAWGVNRSTVWYLDHNKRGVSLGMAGKILRAIGEGK